MNAELLNGLVRLGHRCRALAPILAKKRYLNEPHRADIAEIEIERYEVPYFLESQLAFFQHKDYQTLECRVIEPRLSAMVDSDRPDVIIIGRETFAGPVVDFANAQVIPTLLIAHSGIFANSLVNGAFSQSIREQLVGQLQRVTAIVVVARHVAADWQRLGCGNVRVIANAVDCATFAPRPMDNLLRQSLDIAADSLVVAHVSNLTPVKRVHDLMGASIIAVAKNAKLTFLIVGDGPYRRDFASACVQEQLAQSFRFTGWIPHSNVAAYLNLADMVVMPSASEAMSLAVLEAQACAKLVLASDIPGARELIRHGETGLLFQVGDIEDLAAKILLAAADPNLRARLGDRAHHEAQTRSLPATIRQYETALHELTQSVAA